MTNRRTAHTLLLLLSTVSIVFLWSLLYIVNSILIIFALLINSINNLCTHPTLCGFSVFQISDILLFSKATYNCPVAEAEYM